VGSASKWRFVDRSGSPFSLRYHQAIHTVSRALWQNYSFVRDEAERNNAEEETLCRVAGYEQEHGAAENLPALIKRIFPCVASTMFVRTPHPGRYEENKEWQDLEALGFALQRSSESPDSGVCARELNDRLKKLLELISKLNERERDIVLLYVRRFKGKQIARKVGTTEDNVYQIIHRFKERLKQLA